MQVSLSTWEYKAAVDLANARMAISNDRNLNHSSTYARTYAERVREEVVGACGEMALCKAMNWFFSPTVNTFHNTADVYDRWEVRATERSDGSLIVRDNDNEERWYVLVTGDPPVMTIRGYILGADARRDEWLRNPHGHRPAWFVPQSALKKLKEKVVNGCVG